MFSYQGIIPSSRSPGAFQKLQPEFCCAEIAADVKDVAGTSSRAEYGAPGRHFGDDGHIQKDFVSPRGVTARQGTLKFARSPPKSTEKLIQPPPGVRFWKREAQEKTSRHSAHGGNVANRARQAFPANRIRRMLVAQEMSSFQEPVARQNGFVASPGPKEGGVIANSNN